MNEIWEWIEGYEGKYQVSNLGRVRSVDRWRANRSNGYIQKGQILKANLDHGYERVNLYKNGKMKHCRVHRLVAQTFLENPFGKEQVNHIDGNKRNNRLDNLEWCTPKENNQHAIDNKLKSLESSNKEIYCFQNGKTYKSLTLAAKELGLYKSNICKVCKGKRKSTGGYTFKYL